MLLLKKIQRRFLLWALVSRTGHDYSPIIPLLNLRSLEEYRWCRWSAFVTWNGHTNNLYISALIDFNASHRSSSKSLLFQCHACKSKYFHWDSPKSYFLPSQRFSGSHISLLRQWRVIQASDPRCVILNLLYNYAFLSIFFENSFFHVCVASTCSRVQIIKLENENPVLIEEIEFLERYSDQPRKWVY